MKTYRIPFLVIALILAGSVSFAGEWSLGDALKQMDKAAKGVRGLTGEVTLSESPGGEAASETTGRVSILTDGRIRIDVEGEAARTILCVPGKLWIHDPQRSEVSEYPTDRNPDKLAQHALVGFAPLGSALEKDYLVSLLEDGELDGRSVIVLELTPKDQKLRDAVSKIQLWIDQANWLPLQQRIFHGGADQHMTLRYSSLARNDNLDKSLFAPKWPKGTRTVKGS